ncbi:hypothetical protein [Actinomyces gaoshouyii]|uniref:hypothetical protein n=1 Tax=Actinomyces gaoshouyii TaxID=1960083 RepID=UPI0009C07B0B|nr:hypothetical protein [Actinomyces gaoshouyii]ARD41576.1 hypothetical protein B6G06_03790 [Actinomyces gaoshouyii]
MSSARWPRSHGRDEEERRRRRRWRRRGLTPASLPAPCRANLPAGRLLGAVPIDESGESWAVAMASGLVIVSTDALAADHPWERIDKGSWDAEARAFTLTLSDAPERCLSLTVPARIQQGGAARPVAVDRFARALRQRVEASLVHLVTRILPSGAQARVTIRRGADGALSAVASPEPASAATAEDRAELEALLREACDSVGLDTR